MLLQSEFKTESLKLRQLSLGAVHKLRYAIEVGGWLLKYNH
jgi:hypothetical protein